MSDAARKWDDLKTRVITGVLLAAAAIFSVWSGGWVFGMFVVLACGAMTWELARMAGFSGTATNVLIALAAALALFVEVTFKPVGLAWPIPLVIIVFNIAARRLEVAGTVYLAAVFLTGVLLVALRENGGAGWVAWLVLVVVVSDIAGYLAGRALGGPKFWPRISPKKTWSGTVAGWIGAALVGAVFAPVLHTGWVLVPVSAVLSLFGQLGDIAESAMKRATGIKDSSNLLPGHGGVLDRFDALIGAAVGFMLLDMVFGFPG